MRRSPVIRAEELLMATPATGSALKGEKSEIETPIAPMGSGRIVSPIGRACGSASRMTSE